MVRLGAAGPAYLFGTERAARAWAGGQPWATTFLFPVYDAAEAGAGAVSGDAAPAPATLF